VRSFLHRAELSRAIAVRWMLVPIFVMACFQFDWQFLRQCTTAVILLVSSWIGLSAAHVDADVIALNGIFIQFTVSCTFIDAFCGSIPLLWKTSASVAKNVVRLIVIFLAVSSLNIVRLELGFLGFAHGMPWWLAHECVSGLVYFAFLVFIIKQRARGKRSDVSAHTYAGGLEAAS
jgi:exosortase/archaeosortase